MPCDDYALDTDLFHGIGLERSGTGLERCGLGDGAELLRAGYRAAVAGQPQQAARQHVLEDDSPAIREGMGQDPTCSLQNKTRGLDQQTQTK